MEFEISIETKAEWLFNQLYSEWLEEVKNLIGEEEEELYN